jgi:hypothetical protein
MMRHRLRIFTGEEDATPQASENVTIKLGDIPSFDRRHSLESHLDF